jgi:hypothetical protein
MTDERPDPGAHEPSDVSSDPSSDLSSDDRAATAAARRPSVLRISSEAASGADPRAEGSTDTSGAAVPRRAVAAPRVAVPASVRRPRTSLAIAVGVLVALVGGATVLTPKVTAAETAPRPEPVASTELVCPVTTGTRTLTSTIAAGVATLPTVSTGVATLADLATTSTSTAPQVIRDAGTTVSRVITGKPGPALLGRATGSFAQGFGADQTIRSGQAATRGLAAAPCTRPVTDAWLVGGGSAVGRLTQVLLVNDDDRPAQVDLLVYSASGPISNPVGQGIVLAAGSRRQIRLDTIAPNQPYLAVHVIARAGRIGVLGLDQRSVGLVPEGMSLLPASDAGTRLVIPAVPEPVRYVVLTLVSPEVDTTVNVTVLTPDGPVVPTDIATVTLPAGKIVALRVDAALASVTSGLLLTSDAPVAAGVEVGTGSDAQLHEHDATGPAPELTAPGIVVGLAGLPLRHAVMVSAPGAASSVRLDLYAPGSKAPTWTRTLAVGAGSLAAITIPVTTPTASSMLVVTPLGGGPVYASRMVTEAGARGPMMALAPIYPQRASTLVPAVVSAPGSSVTGVSRR